MHPSLRRLLALATRLAVTRQEETERVAALLIATPEQGSWDSTLNNDGSPVQICVTLPQAASPPAVRLVADPAAGIVNILDRYERADRVLRELVFSHGPEMQSLCASLIEGVLPTDAAWRTTVPGRGCGLPLIFPARVWRSMRPPSGTQRRGAGREHAAGSTIYCRTPLLPAGC